jgi:uncharacterized protein DUF2793
MSDTPNVRLPLVPEGTLDPAAGLNLALIVADALIQTGVISLALTAPPGGPSDGDMYIVAGEGGTATGAWATHENDLARYVAEGAFWQFYAAGTQVKFLLNQDDEGLYKFTGDSSLGNWVLAAGISDAPTDGQTYGRRDGAWETVSLTFEDEASTPLEVTGVSRIVIGTGLVLSEDTSGVVRLESNQGFAQVLTETGTARDATAAQAGTYVRFTNAGEKTYTFDDDEGYSVGDEFHGRNVGAGDLTIDEATGMTVNAPFGGTLVIPQHGTFTVKIVASNQADLIGVTVQAS